MAEDFRILLGAQVNNASVQAALNKVPDAFKTITVKVKGDNAFIKTTTQEGNLLNETMTKVNKVTGATSTEFEKASVSATKVNTSTSKMNSSMATATKTTGLLGQKITSVFAKVVAFGAVTSVIGLFTKGVYEAVQVVKDLDSAMVDFKKVSDLSGDELSDYADKLGELGESVYRSKTEMLEAATIFKQGGYDENQAALLARTANLFENIADTEVSAAESAKMIISQLKAFNLTAEDSEGVVDVINEVNKLAFPFGNIWVIKDNYIG